MPTGRKDCEQGSLTSRVKDTIKDTRARIHWKAVARAWVKAKFSSLELEVTGFPQWTILSCPSGRKGCEQGSFTRAGLKTRELGSTGKQLLVRGLGGAENSRHKFVKLNFRVWSLKPPDSHSGQFCHEMPWGHPISLKQKLVRSTQREYCC
jgi:hypothetical protein